MSQPENSLARSSKNCIISVLLDAVQPFPENAKMASWENTQSSSYGSSLLVIRDRSDDSYSYFHLLSLFNSRL